MPFLLISLKWPYRSVSHNQITSRKEFEYNFLVTYIDENRIRVSSESAYLTNDVLARPNLKVVLHATVTRIITKKVGNEVQATGVEFAKSKNGPRFTAHSKREIIVAYVIFLLLISNIAPDMLPQVPERFIHPRCVWICENTIRSPRTFFRSFCSLGLAQLNTCKVLTSRLYTISQELAHISSTTQLSMYTSRIDLRLPNTSNPNPLWRSSSCWVLHLNI